MELKDELNKHLAPDESAFVSLPGSFGEALAVTDKRIFVLRDRVSGLNSVCDVFQYPLNRVNGAQTASSGTGGYIQITPFEPVAEPDMARVYFPSYDLDKFKAAADYISKVIVDTVPISQEPATSAVKPGGEVCPKCGASIDQGAAFCNNCGAQARARCPECGETSPAGSRFCGACGRELKDTTMNCPKCGTPHTRWMSYCVECGARLQANCMACGTAIMPNYKFCGNCGRQIGTDRLDPRAAQAATRRLTEFRESEEGHESATPVQSEATVSSSPAPSAPASAGAPTADECNRRGQQLFENDQIEDAIKQFKMAVSLEPTNPTYHCNLAVAYDECDRDEDALREYEMTLELAPNDVTALLSLGYMYSENEEPDKARHTWEKVLKVAPDSAEAQEAQENLRNLGAL